MSIPTSNRGSLCPLCKFVREIRSDKGSTFWQCTLSKKDARYGKYPPQPVLRCDGYRER